MEHTNLQEVTPYFIGKPVPPPLFDNFIDEKADNLLQQCIEKDIAWSLAGGLPDKENRMPLVGSWTPFQKTTTVDLMTQSEITYLPTIPKSPEYPVCKKYLDFLLDTIEHLELPHIFVHADEQVYARILHLLWKHRDLYSKIIPLMGGFHQLRVFQRILYKRYSCLGFQDWFVDAGTIAAGSVNQAFEGRHYFRSMRLHKEAFDALVQLRVDNITKNFQNIDHRLLTNLITLRESPSDKTLEQVTNMKEYKELVNNILSTTGTRSMMTVNYLKDVSNMLAIVSAVRTGNIVQHLQAERRMLNLVFAFDHINYARYNSFQHVFLRKLPEVNPQAFQDLLDSGFGATSTGEPFSTIHGDLVTEHFNKECKGTAGPFRSGYISNYDSVNKWIITSHIHSKLRQVQREKLRLNTSSKHKETTLNNKKLHQKHVESLKSKLKDYNIDPFGNSPTIHMSSGEEIEKSIIDGLLNASEIGDEKYLSFVQERLVKGSTKSIFDPIKKSNIKTNIEKKRKTNKVISVLKEDKQAFGIIAGKPTNLQEAFSYPITSLPLSIAFPDSSLYQGDKAGFRNFIMKNSNSVSCCFPTNSKWIYDGMAVMRAIKPRKTYFEWCVEILRYIKPPENANATSVDIVMDMYVEKSVKEGTRRQRGCKPGPRVHVSGLHQNMPQGEAWQHFLSNGDNKNNLITVFVEFIKSSESKEYRRYVNAFLLFLYNSLFPTIKFLLF